MLQVHLWKEKMCFPESEFVNGKANSVNADSLLSNESGIRLRKNNMWRQNGMQYIFLLTYTTHCPKSCLYSAVSLDPPVKIKYCETTKVPHSDSFNIFSNLNSQTGNFLHFFKSMLIFLFILNSLFL